ncbi:rod shape-determining protein MreC [Neoehrlichia mikurensis]|uniref:Cell shape-determining protein MreC n=1 Tax=Neoehrlichia mikurensis TaxID=89586 RepID=A0A9Q9F4R3_9RICK|nr:rod shape-determining protein MreC [Neoehrlichia mikurensis]QXK92023.1 rod shape-determining protein MreC [Neoehrlichia mikurensis]QXK92481.1 rod shape-determining protein MreC [Neoehrlichia mikurensis]QXK93716.1 rod shape-determining protein MreC [Neoehrlichia mikurensis]UTO55311.1 rod shape-determining protein MreC [Neoehrlichia mikurensis]UTO56231.1 rod shape-determining protein MreC [Neoehrlichia mikurensis]
MKYFNIKQKNNLSNVIYKYSALFFKFRVYFFIVISIALFITNFTYNNAIKFVRTVIVDKSLTIVNNFDIFLKQHFNTFKNTITPYEFHSNVLNQNILLMRTLYEENLQLKKLLNFLSYYGNVKYITSHIISSVVYNGINNFAFIPIGSESGIKANQAVVNEHGLVGKVVDVGNHVSRILLITDKDFHVPVMIVESGINAIMTGSIDQKLKLTYFSSTKDIQDGEIVITMGDNKNFPYGIYVGNVLKNNVITNVNLQELNFVSVLSLQ